MVGKPEEAVPSLKAEEAFPNDWSICGTMVSLLLYGLTENPSDRVSPCVIIFVYNFIIDQVRHSIHLFYLEHHKEMHNGNIFQNSFLIFFKTKVCLET